jgi:hypothetical protein
VRRAQLFGADARLTLMASRGRIGTTVARRRSRCAVVCIVLALALAVERNTFAQPPPPAERAQLYSAYEEETIGEVLAALHAVREPKPEGKAIERIDVVPLDVFEPRDPVPRWFNVFHATTRRPIVRREMLLREGQAYQQTLIDETIRNLRRLPELSLVLVVTTVGSSPDRVGVVVITKDVWSLRAGWDIVATPGGIEEFLLAPTETNLLGTHQTVRATFIYEPSTYTFSLGYTMPRIEDSRIAALTSAGLVVNQASGAPEGSYGYLVAGAPLYSGLTPWAWSASATWEDLITRRYVNARPSLFRDRTTGERVPFEYRSRQYDAAYEVTRSLGWENKHDFTFGAGVYRVAYRAEFPGANPQTVADFVAAVVPRSDTRVGPSIQYHAYTKRYLRVINFDTLALQEDFHLGHDVVLRVYPSFHALGGRDVLGFSLAAQYTASLRDGLARVSLATTTEHDMNWGDPFTSLQRSPADASFSPTAHLVTPTIARLGRIVADGTLVYRWRNYLNQIDYLGGEGRLRGFPTSFFVGKDTLSYNMELRSLPVEILTCQIAGVGFYDVGQSFNGWSHFEPFQSVGFGLRALLPQLDRLVFRADIGFPVKRPIDPATGAPIPPFGFLVTFQQAFGVPTVAPASVLPTGQ